MQFDSTIIYVSDLEISKQFYLDILGCVIDHEDTDYVSLKVDKMDSVFIALNSEAQHQNKVGNQTIVLRTQNIEDNFQSLTRKGANIESPLKQMPWAKTFTISDPDGNRIEILEYYS